MGSNTCVKDAYVKDDKHWVFGFKHGCEISIEVHSHLYGKMVSWLHLDSSFSGFFMFCMLGIVQDRIYGIALLKNGVIGITDPTLLRRALCMASNTWFLSRY